MNKDLINELCKACYEGILEDVKKYIEEYNCDINYFDRYKDIPITSTCFRSKKNTNEGIKILTYLLEKGADINKTIEYSDIIMSPLHKIIIISAEEAGENNWDKSNTAFIEFFIKNGADINSLTSEGFTPLDYAIQCRNLEAELLLKSYNAINTERFMQNEYPDLIFYRLLNLCEENDLESFKNIINELKNLNMSYLIHGNETYNDLFIEISIRKFNNQLLKLLIDEKVNINKFPYYYLNRKMTTPLQYAVFCNNLDAIKILIDNNVELNTLTKDGKTALDMAIELGHNLAVDYLREHGGKTSKELEEENKS